MKMTMDEYDAQCEALRRIENRTPTWWPAVSDVEKNSAQKNSKLLLLFYMWLLETAEEPVTEEDKLSKRRINACLRKNIILLD